MSNEAPGAGEPIEIKSCDDVLTHVFEFLDHETDDSRRAVIAEHLEDCSSCLREFGIEQEFKALVRRRCGRARWWTCCPPSPEADRPGASQRGTSEERTGPRKPTSATGG